MNTEMTQSSAQAFSLTPKSLDEAMKYADLIANSEVVPQDYRGKPGNVLVAMQMGMELGLQPIQALQGIAVINGRPCVWGDSLIAIVRGHPSCEYIREEWDDSTWTATCRVKRRGEEEQVRTFGHQDAQAAGLTGKKGPWQDYPKRMIQMRARGFALRDVFPDALRGIAVAEEVRDIPEKDVTPEPANEPEQLPAYPQDRFEENLPKWQQAIQGGRISVEEVIAKASSSYQLTDEQAERIRQCQPIEGGE
ncbi:recombinase RecT [Halorhodospira sp. 9622]|uniref:recombinase RecT n=1 Tax=Halorhodospira sp. 9622 TaxID=2899136 RepID=UPI001EE918BD|nr:recombinase RecT [Halorhodospira sp. 9622]MCG5538990.1 recombinase RecT [Halorhodospira sp. 9622]